MKTCKTCNETKPLTDFYPHSEMADGRVNHCKECQKARSTANRWANIDRIRAYDRRRGSRQGPEYLQAYRAQFPNKYQAHTIVGNAIRDGRLERQPCEVCGAEYGPEVRVHAHHDDYAAPLAVRWLCSQHHKQWHQDHGQAANP